jgi:hypothetical protein
MAERSSGVGRAGRPTTMRVRQTAPPGRKNLSW